MRELRRITERYRLDRLVSASTTGDVFQGIDLSTGEPVAVKLISGDSGESEQQRERFLATCRALQALRHPSLPRVLDYGFTESHAFLVTEYLDGSPFAELAGAASLRVLTLLLLLVDGLEALASRGIATRNLRAENLLVVPEAGEEQVKILGLGSAVLEPGAVPVLDGYSDDLHAFALLACRLLKIPTASPLGIPLAVAVELRDVEALHALLDAALKGDPDGIYPSFVEVRQALRSALRGESRPRTGGFETHPGAAPPVGVDPQAASDAENALLSAPPLPWAPALSATSAAASTAVVKIKPVASPAPIVQILPDLNDLDGTMMVLEDHFIAAAPQSPPAPPAPLAMDVTQAAEATGASRPPMPLPPGDPFAQYPVPPESNPSEEVGVDTIARPPDTRTFVAPRPSFWRSRLLWIGLPVAALLGTGIAAVLFFVLHPGAEPPPPPALVPAVAVSRPLTPPAAPAPAPPAVAPAAAPAHPQLVLAETALAASDLKGVKTALDAISPADQAALRPDERERYQRLLDALTPLQREELASALARGLARGDLRALRSAVSAVPPAEQGSLPPAVQKDLARARQAVEIDGRLARAQKEGSLPEVIRQAGALLAALPRAARAGEAKERAARALETAADGEIEAGQYDAAAARLESLRQVWPDRPGLAGRSERLAAERKADQDADILLAAVARAEKAGKPLDGLQLLAGARPSRRSAPRFQEARQRLEAAVAQLDRRPPELSLRGPGTAYEKGKTATIPLRIIDDFAVKTVEGWARPEGGEYVKVAVRHLSGTDYAMDVPPDLHQNKTVEFYATAADPSGHSGQLGSADHPLKMKRKSWIDKILRKNEKDGGP
jgi:hypothetical protein